MDSTLKVAFVLTEAKEGIGKVKMNNKPKSRIENIVIQYFESEVLIYDLAINKAFCLNEASAKVYHLCDGRNSVADIAEFLSKQMKEPITEDFVWLALDGLKKENLLEESERFEINFHGLNRRQVIKKIGFASLVALPVIASVVAPSAAIAQSGCKGLGQSCIGNSVVGDCCPGVSFCNDFCIPCIQSGTLAGCLGTGNPGTPGICNQLSYKCCSGIVDLTANDPNCPVNTGACVCR